VVDHGPNRESGQETYNKRLLDRFCAMPACPADLLLRARVRFRSPQALDVQGGTLEQLVFIIYSRDFL
jgi:hypothetical protein